MTTQPFFAIIAAYRKENNMDIRVRAFIRSLGMLAVCLAASVLVALFFKFFPAEYIPHLFISGLVIMMVYIGYSISLSQLKAEESLKEISKKY